MKIENTQVITYKDGIIVPETLRNQILTWYYHISYHSGRDRMYMTMAETLYWDKIEADVTEFIKDCPTC